MKPIKYILGCVTTIVFTLSPISAMAEDLFAEIYFFGERAGVSIEMFPGRDRTGSLFYRFDGAANIIQPISVGDGGNPPQAQVALDFPLTPPRGFSDSDWEQRKALLKRCVEFATLAALHPNDYYLDLKGTGDITGEGGSRDQWRHFYYIHIGEMDRFSCGIKKIDSRVDR